MRISGSLPVHPSATDIGSAGQQADQRRIPAGAGEESQTHEAVKPSGEAETASGDHASATDPQGRGRLIDVKV